MSVQHITDPEVIEHLDFAALCDSGYRQMVLHGTRCTVCGASTTDPGDPGVRIIEVLR